MEKLHDEKSNDSLAENLSKALVLTTANFADNCVRRFRKILHDRLRTEGTTEK